MAFHLQGIQFNKSEYIVSEHLGRLAGLNSFPNIFYPKNDSDRRTGRDNDLNHQGAPVKAADREVGP